MIPEFRGLALGTPIRIQPLRDGASNVQNVLLPTFMDCLCNIRYPQSGNQKLSIRVLRPYVEAL